jgi:hypothetical protein
MTELGDSKLMAILETMQTQMAQMQALQAENLQLRTMHQTSGGDVKRKPPERPAVEAGMDDSDWAVFLDIWNRYL